MKPLKNYGRFMEKIKVVHWRNVLGDDLETFKLVLKHNQAMKKYGKSKIEIPDDASEMYHKKIWQLEQEGWYCRGIDYNGNPIFMHLIPSDNSQLEQRSYSIIDAGGKRREYIAKRDFAHNDYQEAIEREYYDPDFPSEVDEAIESLSKTMEVKG
jgi:hypothetical protein